MEAYSSTSTSSSAVPTLPIHHRQSCIRFQNGDGTVGSNAYPINYDELYNLKGRLLTLVDATYTDPEQRKAQKDLVWATLRAWMVDIETRGGGELAHDGVGQSSGPKDA